MECILQFFYSNHFSTIAKDSERYFSDIAKLASTLFATKLADKIFAFFVLRTVVPYPALTLAQLQHFIKSSAEYL